MLSFTKNRITGVPCKYMILLHGLLSIRGHEISITFRNFLLEFENNGLIFFEISLKTTLELEVSPCFIPVKKNCAKMYKEMINWLQK